ncbi:MAG TPA: nitroreductase family protein [Methylomusa anaerophila]|uniref:Putative NAD(P)H nitroreductase n=1 Tax=Methylomusa anaerophila TaxID=1930071 RepID=A0A348AFP7_9FIRM|nr:nitroreductase family protein [Methylomusa anaerophila]BBB89895.1 putative NAD(P)H nitroreductase YdjA [Methylomusa anaerophila]HML90555.1 nitroreductase family protein [Methylomusa anaerophila]
MEFFDVINKRRSIRKFKPDPIHKENILKILNAANWAPSALNLQPWEFLVVSGEKKNKLGSNYGKIVDNYTKDWAEAPDKAFMPRSEFIQFANIYGGAPVIIIVLAETHDDPNYQKAFLESASAAMENMLLAATALGLGGCWMTGPLADEKYLRKVLSIPDDREVVAISPIGYPAVIPEPRPRLDPDLTRKVKWLE